MSTDESIAELAVSFQDIDGLLAQPVLEDRVEDIVQEPLNFREVFREYNARNINSNVVQLPVPQENIGQPKLVEEGAEFPRSQEDYRLETLEFDKFGFEVELTYESQQDSQVNLVRDQVDRQAREMAEDMNRRAYKEIEDSIGGTTVSKDSGANGTFEFDDLLAGRRNLVEKSYDPDMLIVDVEATHDLLGTDFLDATNEGAQMRRSGMVGEVAGLTIIEDSSKIEIAGVSGPAALMVDSDYFGYEGVRDPVMTEDYEEKRSMADIFRIMARYGWLVMEEDAGVFIEG